MNRLRRSTDLLASLFIFAASLALYGRTLAPSLLSGDSAEFQLLAQTLGMTHPTGYPVYLLLAKVFTFLPLLDPAARVTLVSAVCAALAASLVFLLARALGAGFWAALAAPVFFGLQRVTWWFAVIPELYAVSACWTAAVLLCVLRWRQSGESSWLFAAGLLGGLSPGVHNTIALAAPAVVIFLALALLLDRPRPWRAAAAGAGGAALGLLLTLAAFFLIDSNPTPTSIYHSVMLPVHSSFGLSAEQFASPFQRIAFIMRAPQFQDLLFSTSSAEARHNLEQYRYFTFPDTGAWTGMGLAALGLAASFLPRPACRAGGWRSGVLLLTVFAAQVFFVTHYGVRDIHGFYLPSFVPLAVWAALGADAAARAAGWVLQGRGRSIAQAAAGLALAALLAWPHSGDVRASLRAAYPIFLEKFPNHGYPYPQRGELDGARQEALLILNQVEDDAIIFADWGKVYSLYYVAWVEEQRRGITIHEMQPFGTEKGSPESLAAYLDAALGARPVYLTETPQWVYSRYRWERAGAGLMRLTGKKP